MASTPHDDGFREIQLNSKQLVFLFMAVTVVSVVIFLFGVLVGRGVGEETTMAATEAAVAEMAAGEPLPPPAASASASNEPTTSGEVLTYAERLGEGVPVSRDLRKDPEPPPPAPEPAPKAAEPAPRPSRSEPTQTADRSPAPKAPAPPAAAATPGEPAGSGIAVQVGAFREQAEANAIASRLIGKGYKAYVMAPVGGSPSVYRVRVGKFKDRREADAVASRLQKEEQFKPWVVR